MIDYTEISLIDPNSIEQKDLPLVVLADNLSSFFGWGIKAHTDGQYSHIMMMIEPGKFATQGWTFHNTPIKTYTSDQHRLKFWKPKFNKEEKAAFCNFVYRELEKPWYNRRYDVLGVIGKRLNIDWLNNPFTNYCSESVSEALNASGWEYGRHPSPIDLNVKFKADPVKWDMLGYYFQD